MSLTHSPLDEILDYQLLKHQEHRCQAVKAMTSQGLSDTGHCISVCIDTFSVSG